MQDYTPPFPIIRFYCGGGYYGPERERGSAEHEIKGQDEKENYGGYEKEHAEVLV